MKQSLQGELLELSQRIIEIWYQGDESLVDSYLAEQVSWIGSTESQFYRGKEEVQSALKRACMEIIPCVVSKQHYFIADSGRDYCMCVGRYVATLDQEGMFMSEQQRASFLWKQEKEGLRITHIHLSNPMAAVAPDEEFPVKASRQNYRYVQKKIAEREELIYLTTANFGRHLVYKGEIQFVEADKDYTLVHCEDQVYLIRTTYQKLVESQVEDFLLIHRSIAVNPYAIRGIQERNVILLSGEVLPIARTRYLKVCDMLDQLFGKNDRK